MPRTFPTAAAEPFPFGLPVLPTGRGDIAGKEAMAGNDLGDALTRRSAALAGRACFASRRWRAAAAIAIDAASGESLQPPLAAHYPTGEAGASNLPTLIMLAAAAFIGFICATGGAL